MQNQPYTLILTFGLFDPVGALGIQADLSTFAALGCHGLSVATVLLIGDTARIEEVQEIDPDWVSDQARVLLEDMAVKAIKIGAPGNIEQISAIAEIVSDYPDVALILDPFCSAMAQQGQDHPEFLLALRQLLIPQTTLLIVSQVELGRLAETWRENGKQATMAEDASHLIALGCEFVLVTGTLESAPAPGATAPGAVALRADTLFDASGAIGRAPWQQLTGPFLGAGGTLSGAIAARMAHGDDAPQAVAAAQHFTAGALRHAQRFGMGKLLPNRFFLQLSGPGAIAPA